MDDMITAVACTIIGTLADNADLKFYEDDLSYYGWEPAGLEVTVDGRAFVVRLNVDYRDFKLRYNLGYFDTETQAVDAMHKVAAAINAHGDAEDILYMLDD